MCKTNFFFFFLVHGLFQYEVKRFNSEILVAVVIVVSSTCLLFGESWSSMNGISGKKKETGNESKGSGKGDHVSRSSYSFFLRVFHGPFLLHFVFMFSK